MLPQAQAPLTLLGPLVMNLKGKGQPLEKLEGRNVEYAKATNVTCRARTVTDVGYFTIEAAWMICHPRNLELLDRIGYVMNVSRALIMAMTAIAVINQMRKKIFDPHHPPRRL